MAKHVCAASLLLVALLVSSSARAQPASGAAGHWEGALQVPGQELKIALDLAPDADTWQGTIAIPAQNLKGFPLAAITIQGQSVSFALNGVPGNPQFKGTVSQDGKSMSGDFSQGGGTIPFAVARTGDAKFEPLPKSTPITKDLEGAWEGSLEVGGVILRLNLKLSSGADGVAKGILVSVDQGGAEVPIDAIVQNGSHLKLIARAVAGTFEGDLKDGQLTGTWMQGPNTLPLAFKRPAAPR